MFVAGMAFADGEHRQLLPQPQQITYGTGRLPIRDLTIGLPANPSAEDRFAAADLADALASISGAKIPVREGDVTGRVMLKRTGSIAALPEKDEAPGPSGRESYRIRITPGAAEIMAPSSAGLFYAVQTLRQMVEGRAAEAALPEADIHDWPAMAYRGFMMDLSHGSLLREDEIRRQLDFLARFKANQYYFYSEGAIELKGYSLMNPKARYSQAQIRRIVSYARERHIDVVPCVELFGHLHDLFRVERYATLGAVEHGRDLNPRNPQVAGLLRDWIGQLSELFPSPWFHVGLDEPFELDALGSAATGGVPPHVLFRPYLEMVADLVRTQGKRMLFWADIHTGVDVFDKDPELVNKLPAGVVPVPWAYDAKSDYTSYVESFGKAGRPQVIATGVTCWNDVFPDYSTIFTNITGFIADGRKHGAIGIINTGWTDDAQTIYRPVLPGIAFGAAASWQAAPLDPGTFFTAYTRQMYVDDVARNVAAALTALSDSRDLLARAVGSETMHRFWEDALEPERLAKAAAHREELRRARMRAEDAMEALMHVAEQAPDDPTLPSLQLAADMLDYLGMKQLYAVELADFFRRAGPKPNEKEVYLCVHLEGSSQNHSRIGDLMDSITSLKSDYEQAWRLEWTSYRLGSALGRFDAEYEYWRSLQARMESFVNHYTEGDVFPPLDSFRPRR
jgi:hypothetical protein